METFSVRRISPKAAKEIKSVTENDANNHHQRGIAYHFEAQLNAIQSRRGFADPIPLQGPTDASSGVIAPP